MINKKEGQKMMLSFVIEDSDGNRRMGYQDVNQKERIPPIYFARENYPTGARYLIMMVNLKTVWLL